MNGLMLTFYRKALVMMIAGSDTVGNALAVGTFHILKNPKILEILMNELKEAWPEKDAKVGYEKLEKLPYLVSFPRKRTRIY